MIKFIIILLCGLLWRLGGWDKARWSGYRDILIPIILALYFAISLKTWWLFFALGATMQIIRLGYGAYDPEHDDKPSLLASITHDRQGWIVRGLWAVIAFGIGYLPLFWFLNTFWLVTLGILFVAINTFLCWAKASDWIIEPLVGIGFSLPLIV